VGFLGVASLGPVLVRLLNGVLGPRSLLCVACRAPWPGNAIWNPKRTAEVQPVTDSNPLAVVIALHANAASMPGLPELSGDTIRS
jgi:hypothetical protein